MTNTTPRRNRSRRNTTDPSGTHQLAGMLADTTQGPEPEQYTHAEAQADVASAAQTELMKELARLTSDLARARENVTKTRARLDRAIARAVSSEPTRVNWYDHPGPLSRRQLANATTITPVALSRTMERYRASHGSPKRTPTRARRATS